MITLQNDLMVSFPHLPNQFLPCRLGNKTESKMDADANGKRWLHIFYAVIYWIDRPKRYILVWRFAGPK
jgi:hypothetical protein